MVNTLIQNKALTSGKREAACNAARRCLTLAREEELKPLEDVFRSLAHDLLIVAESGLSAEKRAAIQRKIDAMKGLLEVKA